MQLLINNMVSGQHWVEELSGSEIRIGRTGGEGEQPDVILASVMVSRNHAILSVHEDQWTIEHLGVNETLLDNQALIAHTPTPITPGNNIRIGEFALSLIEPAEQEIVKQDQSLSFLIGLERRIHENLLQRMDLRHGESITDLSSDQTHRRVEQHLEEIIEPELSKIDAEQSKSIFRLAVSRRFNAMISATGSKNEQQHVASRDPFEMQLKGILRRMGEKLGISFAAKKMEADSKKLDQGFDTVFTEFDLEFGSGLRKHIIHTLVMNDIVDLIFGLGPLQDLLDMDIISEIMVVSKNQIFIEKNGIVEDSHRVFFSNELLMATIERIVAPVGRRIDRSTPLVDARLADGSRVNVVIPPLAIKGPCLTIRKFSKTPLEMDDLISFGALNTTMSRFLRACSYAQKNIIVSGGTGSGKTTLLNCLSRYIPHKDRIITIEDTAELQLKQSHVVTLETRPPNMEGKGAITIRDLVKNALRMRPDRVIVGECRGAETLDMLQAMNTGHDGSMTTAHANSPDELVLRLETMVLSGTDMPIPAIREQIRSALHLVVQLTRFGDGARRITHISEVTEIDETTGAVIIEDIFIYREAEADSPGRFIHTGYIPSFIYDLLKNGGIVLEDLF